MGQKKITELQLRSSVTDSVSFPGDDGIQTYRMTAAQIFSYISSKFTSLTAVTPATGDYIPLVDVSDSNNPKKATIADIAPKVLSLTATPTVQRFTSGSGTYATPAGVKYIKVRAVGGGGGGGSGNGSGAGDGSDGADTTFGTSLLTAGKGLGGHVGAGGGNSGGAGGAVTVNSPALNIASMNGNGGAGSSGSGSGAFYAGGVGGNGFFGGLGYGSGGGLSGSNAAANSGSGGCGGCSTGSGNAGAGGGSGAYIEALISSPGATYSYAVGAGGAGGGGSGNNGTAGGSGIIIIEEYYQ